jgi:hypothetical protein
MKYLLKWILFAAVLLPCVGQAQYFSIPGNGDLLAGFRKTGAHQGTNELVVGLGNITNLLKLPIGSTITLSNLPPERLTDAFGSDFTFLQWSVFGANYNLDTAWVTPLGNFPQATVWYTLARPNPTTRSKSPARLARSAQIGLGNSMWSVGNGANFISSRLPDGINLNNTSNLIREPYQAAYLGNVLTFFMGDPQNSSLGDLGGSVINYSIEQITPSPFAASSRADLYEVAPAPGFRPVTNYVDPVTGSTTSVYYVGYFDLSPAGVLTFNREADTAPPPPPPPAPTLSLTISGAANVISFGTTNGATYTLVYTNSSGLAAPLSTWPILGVPILGTGGPTNFVDSTANSDRFYGISTHL